MRIVSTLLPILYQCCWTLLYQPALHPQASKFSNGHTWWQHALVVEVLVCCKDLEDSFFSHLRCQGLPKCVGDGGSEDGLRKERLFQPAGRGGSGNWWVINLALSTAAVPWKQQQVWWIPTELALVWKWEEIDCEGKGKWQGKSISVRKKHVGGKREGKKDQLLLLFHGFQSFPSIGNSVLGWGVSWPSPYGTAGSAFLPFAAPFAIAWYLF